MKVLVFAASTFGGIAALLDWALSRDLLSRARTKPERLGVGHGRPQIPLQTCRLSRRRRRPTRSLSERGVARSSSARSVHRRPQPGYRSMAACLQWNLDRSTTYLFSGSAIWYRRKACFGCNGVTKGVNDAKQSYIEIRKHLMQSAWTCWWNLSDQIERRKSVIMCGAKLAMPRLCDSAC